MRFLREGDAVLALERIKKDNPLPSICGRICPAPCERACIFDEESSAISIRALERYACDHGVKARVKSAVTWTGKQVAIVGSGPSAMSAASVFLRAGIKVTMFEAANEPGGVLRYGIPEFRLPQAVLDAEFEDLVALGLDLRTNVLIGRMKPLDELASSFDAVLLATGASLPDFASIKGENLPGVYYAEEFLTRVQLLSKQKITVSGLRLFRGQRTLVVGSGYAAFDAARLALRSGQQVELVFGGLEEELGLPQSEIREAVEEGLKIHTPFDPIEVIGAPEQGALGVQCRRLEMIEDDKNIALKLADEEPVVLEAETIILANSQRANPLLFRTTPQLKINDDGACWTQEDGFKTSLDKVFVQGAAAQVSMNVVESIASGKRTAQYIMEHFNS